MSFSFFNPVVEPKEYQVPVDGKTYKVRYAGDGAPDENLVREMLAGKHPNLAPPEEVKESPSVLDWVRRLANKAGDYIDTTPVDSAQSHIGATNPFDPFTKGSPFSMGGEPATPETAQKIADQDAGIRGGAAEAVRQVGSNVRELGTPTNLALMAATAGSGSAVPAIRKAGGALQAILGAKRYGEGLSNTYQAAKKGNLQEALLAGAGTAGNLGIAAYGTKLAVPELANVNPVIGTTPESLALDAAPGTRIGSTDPHARTTKGDSLKAADVDLGAARSEKAANKIKNASGLLFDDLNNLYENLPPQYGKKTDPVHPNKFDAITQVYSEAADAGDLETTNQIEKFLKANGLKDTSLIYQHGKAVPTGTLDKDIPWLGKSPVKEEQLTGTENPEDLAAATGTKPVLNPEELIQQMQEEQAKSLEAKKGRRETGTSPRDLGTNTRVTSNPNTEALSGDSDTVIKSIKGSNKIITPDDPIYDTLDKPQILAIKRNLGIPDSSALLYDPAVPANLSKLKNYSGTKLPVKTSSGSAGRSNISFPRMFDNHAYRVYKDITGGNGDVKTKALDLLQSMSDPESISYSGIDPKTILRHGAEIHAKLEAGKALQAQAAKEGTNVRFENGEVTLAPRSNRGIKKGSKVVAGKVVSPTIQERTVPDNPVDNTVTPATKPEEINVDLPAVDELPVAPVESKPVEPLEPINVTPSQPEVDTKPSVEEEVVPNSNVEPFPVKGNEAPEPLAEESHVLPEVNPVEEVNQVKPVEEKVKIAAGPGAPVSAPVAPAALPANQALSPVAPVQNAPAGLPAAPGSIPVAPMAGPVAPVNIPPAPIVNRAPRTRNAPPANPPNSNLPLPVPIKAIRAPKNFFTGKVTGPPLQGPPKPPIQGPPLPPVQGPNIPVQSSLADKIWETPREMQTVLDNSFMGRQGINHLYQHPIEWGKSLVKSTKSFRDANYQKELADIQANPLYQEALDNNLAIKDTGASQFHGGGLGSLVPGLRDIINKSKNVHDIAAGNVRLKEYEVLRNKLEQNKAKEGLQLTEDDLRSIAKQVNDTTGYGELKPGFGKFEGPDLSKGAMGRVLDKGLYGSRFQAGRLSTLNPVNSLSKSLTKYQLDPVYKGPNVLADDLLAKNLLKIGGTAGIGYGAKKLAELFGNPDDVSLSSDVTDSDFGKQKYKNTRIDTTGGTAGKVRDIARIVLGKSKDAENPGDVASEVLGSVGHTLRNSLHPMANLLLDHVLKENPVGLPVDRPFTGTGTSLDEKYRYAPEYLSAVTPMSIPNTAEAVQDLGVKGLIPGLADFFGFSSNTYDDDERKRIKAISDKVRPAEMRHGKGKPTKAKPGAGMPKKQRVSPVS